MGELAGVAFLAQSALVVLANQVADATAFGGWDVMAVRAEGTSRAAGGGFEVGAEGSSGFGWSAEGWEGLVEVVGEGKGGRGKGLWMEDLGEEGRWCG